MYHIGLRENEQSPHKNTGRCSTLSGSRYPILRQRRIPPFANFWERTKRRRAFSTGQCQLPIHIGTTHDSTLYAKRIGADPHRQNSFYALYRNDSRNDVSFRYRDTPLQQYHTSSGRPIRPEAIRIEPDWSAASYWYEIAALAPEAEIFLPNLSNKSLQGDARIAALFEPLGVSSLFSQAGVKLRKSGRTISLYEQNLSEQPDLAQTLVVTCCLIGLPFKFTGLQTLKIKETDRISALQNELIKLGYKLISSDRSLEWDGESIAPKVAPVIETYDDHRMAMAFAPAAFLFPGIKIKDISVVDKSYPNYWKDLCKAGFSLEKDEKEGTRL